MRWFYDYFFPALWAAYLIYWQIAAAHVKTTQRLEAASSRILRSLMFLAAVVLLCVPNIPLPVLYRHFLPEGLASFYTGAAITVTGILFAVWARRHLGSNWSRSVTIKQDHELITSGPYALVRHPIYTGLLTAFFGTAIATTQLRGLIAFALIAISLLYKLRLEEQWMRAQFGDTYAAYSRRVAALVPFLL
jgi:protein-S-isoprenylcysteine O-methyltransferase Ste14